MVPLIDDIHSAIIIHALHMYTHREVTLNGKILSLVNNTTLPDLSPLQQEPTETINLPALSFGFYVFKDVKAEACIS